MNPASENVKMARALEDLPMINIAFQKGELSFSKVRAMTRIAMAENEDYLLNIAEYGTAQHVEVLVKSYRKVSCIAGTAENFNAVKQLNAKRVHWVKLSMNSDSKKIAVFLVIKMTMVCG